MSAGGSGYVLGERRWRRRSAVGGTEGDRDAQEEDGEDDGQNLHDPGGGPGQAAEAEDAEEDRGTPQEERPLGKNFLVYRFHTSCQRSTCHVHDFRHKALSAMEINS